MNQIKDTISIIQSDNYIPTSITKNGNSYDLEWQNVKDYRFTVTESKFVYSINRLNEIKPLSTLITDIEVLKNSKLIENCLTPSGFIFHMARCGSTAFTRAMAQSPDLSVYDEPYPFYTGAFQYLSNNWTNRKIDDTTRQVVIKNLILAMGKKRNNQFKQYFIKFRSWNSVFMQDLRALFPNVPFLFMYRNPVEVLVSTQKRPNELEASRPTPKGAYITNFPLEKTQQMERLEFLTLSIKQMLSIALSFQNDNITYLNYTDFKKENFQAILKKAFNYQPTSHELSLMQNQFDKYSKDQTNKVQFVSDTATKLKAVTADIQQAADEHLNGLVAKLDELKMMF